MPLAIGLLDCVAILIPYGAGLLLHMEGTGSVTPTLIMPFVLMAVVLLGEVGHGCTAVERGAIPAIMGRVAVSCSVGGAIILIFRWFSPSLGSVSPVFIIHVLFFSWVLLLGRRIAVLVYIRREQKKGNCITRLLLVGTDERGMEVARLCEENPGWGVRIVGFLSHSEGELGAQILNNRVIGLVDDLPRILASHEADALLFADGSDLLFTRNRLGCTGESRSYGIERLSRSMGRIGS